MSAVHNVSYQTRPGGETAFTVEGGRIKFGHGVLAELGEEARALGLRRVVLLTDHRVRALPPFDVALRSLQAAGIEVEVHDAVAVEPNSAAIRAAAEAIRAADADGVVSLGGGSVIDTAKAANLLAAHPAAIEAYLAPPLGAGQPIPGPLPPHIACPTTFGTASETTPYAIFDCPEVGAKTGYASRFLRPVVGLVDPTTLYHLPASIVAANGFDVLSHAIESYTARPFTARDKPESAAKRPLSQGANPFSDVASLEAVRLTGRWLAEAVADAGNPVARDKLMLAGLLAGIGFGNAGCHLPHALSYPVAANVEAYQHPDWPAGEALVPHGIAVALHAPAAFRHLAHAAPARFADAQEALTGVRPELADAGEALSASLVELMRRVGLPNGLQEIGFTAADVDQLAAQAFRERRLIDNSPVPVEASDLTEIYRGALRYW